MQLPPGWKLLLHGACASLAVFVAAVFFARRRLREAGPASLVAALLAIASVLFLLFKAGLVRCDVHVYTLVFGLLVVAALLALTWARRALELALALLAVAGLAGGLWAHAATEHGWPTMYFPPVFPAEALARIGTIPLAWQGDARAAERERIAERVRAEHPLPPIKGTVDIYPYEEDIVLEHGFELHPRPVFQSYMAYTPRLARANAEHLAGDDAPQWILLRVAPIDQRPPALDDSAPPPL